MPHARKTERDMAIKGKAILVIIDGQPWRSARRLNGNLEGWVDSGKARVWKMKSALPSMSASCYASIHTGVNPQTHGIVSNEALFRVEQADIFSEVKAAGGVTAAVTHSFWSVLFNRVPWDYVRDIEYDDPEGPISHGRFHTMTGYNGANQMTPSDVDLFATMSMLIKRRSVDYGIIHTCTIDSMGHRFGHDCQEMDLACAMVDGMLAHFLPGWLEAGYEVAVTADHGQSDRGHHGGRGDDQQDVAFYWFGGGEGPAAETELDQLAIAPTLLGRMGVSPAGTMRAKAFLTGRE